MKCKQALILSSKAWLQDCMHAVWMSATHACPCLYLCAALWCATGMMRWANKRGRDSQCGKHPGNARAKASSTAALYRITDQDTHMPQPHSAYTSLPHSSIEYSHTLHCRQIQLPDKVYFKKSPFTDLHAQTVFFLRKKNELFWVRKPR